MSNPYELWQRRKSLGVMRARKPETHHYKQFFTKGFRSTEEYIDFEKLPIRSQKLAPFVLPLGRGRGIYDDTSRAYRFKPAYVKLEDTVDPLRPLTMAPGIDHSMLDPNDLDPMQRLELIKAAITFDHVAAIERRWEWLRAKAINDGKVTVVYDDGTSVLVDFQRDADHTEVLGVGDRYGDSGVSIVDHFQSVVDTMVSAEFGGVPTMATMGGGVWDVMRRDAEFKSHMDINVTGGNITIERGLVSGAGGAKVFKVGEMTIGGGSGQRIELIVNNETYKDNSNVAQRYLGNGDIVFTGTADAIEGHECFGMIVDRKAKYQALPIFPNNWTEGNNPEVEMIGHTSAPLMVPINPDATYKATVVA